MEKLLNPDMIGRDYTAIWWIDQVGYTSETAAEQFARVYWQDRPYKIIEWCGNLFAVEDKRSAYRVNYISKIIEGWPVGVFEIARVHGPLDDEPLEY